MPRSSSHISRSKAQIKGRKVLFASPDPFTFNDQERTDKIYGTVNHNTALYWEFDNRLGRRWNVDPNPNIGISIYNCFRNNPNLYADLLGDSIFINLFNPNKDELLYKVAEEHVKRNVNDDVIVIMAHGDNSVIEYTNKSGNIQQANKPVETFKIHSMNPYFRSVFKNKEKIELFLASWNTGAVEYKTPDVKYAINPLLLVMISLVNIPVKLM